MASFDFDGAGGATETAQESQPQPIQEKKINKKKLSELEPNGRKLSVFWRNPVNNSVTPVDAFRNIPLDVATICCDDVFDQIVKRGNKWYEIKNFTNLDGHKFVFDWVKACAAEQGVANMPELSDRVTEEKGLQPLVDILQAAKALGVPDASFSKFLMKKARDPAKSHLIPLSEVRKAYDSQDEPNYEVRDLCVMSIFEHWYSYVLDDEKYDDYMEQLGKLRDENSELDEDLTKAVSEKDEFIKASRQRKKDRDAEAAIEAGAGGESAGAGWDNGDANLGGGSGGPWDQPAVATEGGNDWDKPSTDVAKDASDKWNGGGDENGVSEAEPAFGDGGDWADEVNHAHTPTPAAAAAW